MVIQRSCGLRKGPVAAAILVSVLFLCVQLLVSVLVLLSGQIYFDKKEMFLLSVTPERVIALAADGSGDTVAMSTHLTSSEGRAPVAASEVGYDMDTLLQRNPLEKKLRGRAPVEGKDWQAQVRRRSSLVSNQLVPGERGRVSESAVDFISVATSYPLTSPTANVRDWISTYGTGTEGRGLGVPRRSQKKGGHEQDNNGGIASPCGRGKVRLDRACVSIPAEDRYDYIVVGCGAVGCPLAKTLADGGYKVLVLERGHKRSFKNTPTAMDIFGAGKAVSDTSVAQLIYTNQGVRTQTAGIMGGGTSINMGIVAMETRTYFENLSKEFGWKFDFNRLEKAFKWISKAFHVMPQDAKYSSRLRSSLQHHGYRPLQTRRSNNVDHKVAGAVDHSPFLHEGYVWGGATLFDPARKFSRDAADIFLYNNRPQQLNAQAGELVVKERRYVERVLFESENLPTVEAACVLHRSTRKEDMAPIGLRQDENWQARKEDSPNSFFKNLFGQIGRLFTSVLGIQSRSQLSCIKKSGEIFLSAGAVHTPLLLFRSGIGPREQLAELGIEPVYANAHVGRHLTDRILVPILLFANETKPRSTREPRVCQVLGMRRVGPACKGAGINTRTLKCSLIATEELSGPNIVHGLLWASHMLFPPSWRDNPALSAALEFAHLCEMKLPVKGTPQYPAACLLLEEYMDCLDRSFSLFYFTTEPKSRGYIRQHRDGRVEIEANYLKDEQDLFDAVRGTQSLIQLVNGGQFDDIAQPLHAESCPVMMLRAIVDLFLRFAQARDLEQYREQLLLVRRHAADLQPSRPDTVASGTLLSSAGLFVPTGIPSQRYPETFGSPSSGGVGSETSESLRLDQKGIKADGNVKLGSYPNAHSYERALHEVFRDKDMLEKLLQSTASHVRSPSFSAVDVDVSAKDELNMSFWAKAGYEPKACVDPHACDKEAVHTETYTTTCLAQDVFSKRFKLPVCTARKTEERTYSPGSLVNTEEWFLGLMKRGLNQFFAADLPPGSKQTLATYPPILPREPVNLHVCSADDPEEVAAFALTYMTSIWHIGGTAAMGFVVDQMFRVKGVKGLSVADASLLNQMTRLNPTATLMTLGRYACTYSLEGHELERELSVHPAAAVQ